jgi:hypothetical protein
LSEKLSLSLSLSYNIKGVKKGEKKMKYYLKILGSNQADGNEDFIETEKESGSEFWEEKSISWLSEKVPQIYIGDIFIQYVPGREPRSKGVFQKRILGYYEVVSKEKTGNLENHWFKYVELKNLSLEFSLKAKQKSYYSEELRIDDYISLKNAGTIASGYKILTEKEAKVIIDAINGIQKPLDLSKIDFDSL